MFGFEFSTWKTLVVYRMEKSELKIKKNSCCVTAFYSLFETLLVVIHINTSYLDIHVLAWIELKIDIINIPGPSQKNKTKTNAIYL